MTPDERLEAAARGLTICRGLDWESIKESWRDEARKQARAALAAAYPELSAGTHWVAPRVISNAMVDAASAADEARASWPALWSAARDAYLKEGEE